MATFDGAAAGYDEAFTRTLIGRWLRARVWARLKVHVQPGMRVLELACGTGEDALWLAQRGACVTATDASAEMLAVARAKVAATPFAERVEFRQVDLNALGAVEVGSGYDAVLSNFGGLNCVADLRALAVWLGGVVRPGGRAVFVVMGPWCPWEIGWYGVHGQWRTATRRWWMGAQAAEIAGRRVPVWYPTAGALGRACAPVFRVLATFGLGSILPPPALGRLVERWPRLLARMSGADRTVAGWWPFRILNDHYVLELERV